MTEFEAYHGKDSNHHQKRFDALAPNGWRMISLSVHGSQSSPRYSAVWVKEAGPKFIAVHDLPISKYQKWFMDQFGKGYGPVLVTATGEGADAVVAAVFEQGLKKKWMAKHGLINGSNSNQNSIEFWCKKASEEGKVLRSGAVYGSKSQRLYIAVWHEELEAHSNWRTADTASEYQDWFNGFREVPLRPGFVTLSKHQLYFSVFRDDPIGEWSARHNMTSEQYQGEFDDFKKKGFYPICVQGGGEGSGTRYAAIFAKRHKPLPRQWTVRGTGLTNFDLLVKKFMQANGIRVGQLSVAKNGVFKAQRAYTWAHEGYPITEISSLMRIASLSKMFNCACIHQLYDDKLLTENTKVFAALGITKKALNSQTVDPRINDITVDHLVNHEGGWDKSIAGDWAYRMRKIAQDLDLNGPPTTLDVVRYMYGEPLQFTPGSSEKSAYSNIGYITLTSLVEKKTGKTFENYLRNTILQPDGIIDVRLSPTLRSKKLEKEVFYDDPGVGLSAAEPTKDKITGDCYGGEGWVNEAKEGSGGLCATSSALVQFIRLHAVWGLGGRKPGAARTGSMAGVSSRAECRSGGVDYAFIFNTRRSFNSYGLDNFTNDLKIKLNSTSL